MNRPVSFKGMKLRPKHYLMPLLFLLGAPTGWAQVQFEMSTARFYDKTNDQPYVELYLAAYGSSLTHEYVDDAFRAVVGYRVVAHSLPDCTRLFSDAFKLKGQAIADTTGRNRAYDILHQMRLPVPAGDVSIQVFCEDLVEDDGEMVRKIRDLSVPTPPKDRFETSDIQFISDIQVLDRTSEDDPSPFTKHGMQIIPHALGDYYAKEDTLMYYLEFYNATQLVDEPYFITASLAPANSPAKNDKYVKIYRPKMPSDFRTFTGAFNIRTLPSQTYRLSVTLKKNSGEPLHTVTRNFYVAKRPEITANADETELFDVIYGYEEAQLDTFLRAMEYIANETEISFIDALGSYDEKKQFFYTFWKRRTEDPNARASKEWFNYLKGIRYANKHFTSNINPGWRSDRGRVLLTYGPPNELENFQDPEVYQIWTYNRIEGQSGVFFLFYASERATNELMLVHSTVNGETYDPYWQQQLQMWADPNSDRFNNRPVTVPTIGTGANNQSTPIQRQR